ncbi:unnamed protein product, partial [Rotaria socialis]
IHDQLYRRDNNGENTGNVQKKQISTVLTDVAKTKGKRLVTAYFRKTKRKSIRKIDFPILLKELFSTAFTVGPVSGGFRRAGISPFNEDVMKEKVLSRHGLYNDLATNDSSAMDILTSLSNEIGSPDVQVNSSDDPSTSSQTAVNSTSASSSPQFAFDDSENDECDSNTSIDIESTKKPKSTNKNLNESFESSSNQNVTDSTNIPSSAPAQMRPPSAVRTLISTYLADKNISMQQAPVTTRSRARAERRFGEDIKNGNLLEELKKKDEIKKMKAMKAMKQKPVQQSQRSSKKKELIEFHSQYYTIFIIMSVMQ